MLYVQLLFEFNLVLQDEKLEDAFLGNWELYSQAIVSYAEATKMKSKDLKHALREEESEGIICYDYVY